jgi:uncharacterized protein
MSDTAIPPLGHSWLDRTIQLLALAALLTLFFETYLYLLAGIPPWTSAVMALAATIVGLALSDGQSDAFGLRRNPVRGWWYWVRMAILFGGIILVLGLLLTLVAWTTSLTIRVPKAPPEEVLSRAWWFCFYAPAVEEVAFRVLLTVALLPWLGPWGTILAGGILFGAVHVLRGNPGPDNLVAGFFLQWAYLRSGTILVPLAMHAAGNAIALTSQLANWALLPDVI